MASLLNSGDEVWSEKANNGPLAKIGHRPYPLPDGPWIMQQVWNDLLFLHWPLKSEAVSRVLPSALRPYLDVRDGEAWVSIVAFHISDLHLRAVPPVPGLSEFAEINVRTYLTIDDQPGVYFFSLDAESRSAVYAARLAVGLNYFFADMSVELVDRAISYVSHRQEPPEPAGFKATYAPESPEPFEPEPDSLEYFLTERYCLYTAAGTKISRLDIHHRPWSLQRAWCEVQENTLLAADGLILPDEAPRIHYAQSQDVLFWWPQHLETLS